MPRLKELTFFAAKSLVGCKPGFSLLCGIKLMFYHTVMYAGLSPNNYAAWDSTRTLNQAWCIRNYSQEPRYNKLLVQYIGNTHVNEQDAAAKHFSDPKPGQLLITDHPFRPRFKRKAYKTQTAKLTSPAFA